MKYVLMCLLLVVNIQAMHGCGSLTVITGPMYSGKTEELIKRINCYTLQDRNVLVCKHCFDNRVADCISSKGMVKTLPAFPIVCAFQLLDVVDDAQIVAIDEVQFFTKELITVIHRLMSRGTKVIVSGLDTDFKRDPFGECMPSLLSIADKVVKFKAVCSVCRRHNARLTQRLVSGAPASAEDELIIIDNGQRPVTYEPRCRDCHVLNLRRSKSCENLNLVE
jgi:thymidine kinase